VTFIFRGLARVSLTLIGLAAASIGAQEAALLSGDDAVLSALVEEALARNPELNAEREELAAARARPAQARGLPDPMLAVGYTNDGVGLTLGAREMTTLGVMWTQDLPFAGKRRLRSDILALDAGVAEQRVERARLSLIAGVRRAYYGLLQARSLSALVREQAELWRQIEGVARARYGVGQGAQQDVLRVQVEVTRVGQSEAEQQAEETVRLAELNRLAARAFDAPLETTSPLTLSSVEEDRTAILERQRAVSPELKAARLSVERARRAVELARRDFKPDFSVQAAYMDRGGLDPMWQASVGVRLPLARERRKNALAEAEARLRAVERGVEAVELQLRYRTDERLAQLAASERAARLYEQGVVPQDRLSVEAAVASYQAGRVPFVAVLEALGTLYADRGAHVRLLAAHARGRAALAEASLEPRADMGGSSTRAIAMAAGDAAPAVDVAMTGGSMR
jgi:outer membrane protein TolC